MARNQISQYTPTESSGGNNEMMDNQNKNTYFKNFQDLVDLLYLNNGTFYVSGPVAEYFITYGEVPDYNTMSKLLGKDSLSTNSYNDIVKNLTEYTPKLLKQLGVDEQEFKNITNLNKQAKDNGFTVNLNEGGIPSYTMPNGERIDFADMQKLIKSGNVPGAKENNIYLNSIGGLDGYYFDNRLNMTREQVEVAAEWFLKFGTNIPESVLIDSLSTTDNYKSRNYEKILEDVNTYFKKQGWTDEDINNYKYSKEVITNKELYDKATSSGSPVDIFLYKNMGFTKPSEGTNTNTGTDTDTDTSTSTGTDTGTDTGSSDDTVVPSYTEDAYNQYYKDIWSLQPGTAGYSIYNNLANAERNAAQSAIALADAQYQNAAMQQAATVKNITDQVRAERMAKLRAGMNEAQIANQDMQMMMSNINALNDQMNAMNYNTLQAQQQYNLAQDTAYKEYLNNAQSMNQTGAAYYAAQTSDPVTQALEYMKRTGTNNYNAALQAVTTGTTGTK